MPQNARRSHSGPCPPRPASEADLPFVRQPMTDWFDPRQLGRTAVRTLLSTVIGRFFDRREMQAALATPSEPSYEADERGEFWFDYVADLGDGFNPTYTVASLLARKRLSLRHGDEEYSLPRGRVLIMGGDQVYPTASLEDYENRLIGPYRSALPCEVEEPVPDLYAIPGNHDWYDGLTTFVRLFTQQQWIGGWRTRQERSYFAIRLPSDLWIWGTDIQMEARIDEPQLAYFRQVARKHGIAGHRIILCTAEPAWVFTHPGELHDERGYANLAYFEEKVIAAHGARLVLTLTGDLHHYSRYGEVGGTRQKLTSGGGGATLFGTHHLPRTLELPQADPGRKGTATYRLEATFPSAEDSRSLSWGAFWMPLKSRAFVVMMGLLFLLIAWLLQSSSFAAGEGLFERLGELPPTFGNVPVALGELLRASLYSPGGVIVLLLIVLGFMFFTGLHAWYAGIAHGLLQVLLCFLALWLLWYAAALLPLPWVVRVLLFSLLVVVVAGAGSGFLVSAYLLAAHWLLALHTNEVFASQAYEHHKNFLRIRVGPQGISIFPVGIERVCRAWELNTAANARPGDPWFRPQEGASLEARLIEGPVHIPL